jgi:hypothetical protein
MAEPKQASGGDAPDPDRAQSDPELPKARRQAVHDTEADASAGGSR